MNNDPICINFNIGEMILFACSITLLIVFIIFAYFSFGQREEEDCVSFYKENGYILDTCEKYENKLELLDK